MAAATTATITSPRLPEWPDPRLSCDDVSEAAPARIASWST